MIEIVDKKIDSLLKKEGLTDFSIYFKEYETFEEYPIFSRYKHIDFLKHYSFNDKNRTLIKRGVFLINDILLRSSDFLSIKEFDDYLVCLTITDWEDYSDVNCLNPIFLSQEKNVYSVMPTAHSKKFDRGKLNC